MCPAAIVADCHRMRAGLFGATMDKEENPVAEKWTEGEINADIDGDGDGAYFTISGAEWEKCELRAPAERRPVSALMSGGRLFVQYQFRLAGDDNATFIRNREMPL